MFSTRWRKVVRELWSNRTRTTLVIASIAVGIFAVGTVQLLRSVILNELKVIYAETNVAQATIFTSGVDEAQLDAIRRMGEVADVQGRSSLVVKVQTAPDKQENLVVTAIDDFDDIRINRIQPIFELPSNPQVGAERTVWPAENEIVIERSGFSSDTALPPNLQVGDTLALQFQDDRPRDVTLTGVVYEPNGFSANFSGQATGYVDFDTFERLGGSRTYQQVFIRVNGTPEQQLDQEYITGVANQVADKIEKGGYTVARVQVPEPGKLALQDLFDALALLLTPLGLLALILSGFLVINTISALMAQQVRQIGVMKAVGAKRYQLVGMYLAAVMAYSLAALAVAVPLTVLAGGGIAAFLGTFINIDFPRWSLPPYVFAIQLLVGLLTPLLAALVPVFKGTGMTVREAVSDYGTNSEQVRDGWLTKALNSVRGLSRPMQLSLRNTFRRRGRLALTLITLVLGGMLFMTVGSVRSSLNGLIEQSLDYYQFDVQIQFEQPYRTQRVEQVARSLPGVAVVEGWLGAQATPILPDGADGDTLTITALQSDSAMVQPTLTDGRWLLPEDENAIVISQNVLASQPDLKPGDTMLLEIGQKEYEFTVVGIARVLGGPPNVIPVYVNYPYYSRLTADVNRSSSLQIKLDPASGLTMEDAAKILDERLEANGYNVASTFTIDTLRRFTGAFFDIIVYLLLAMGVLIASVGALGLAGTMSTNVLERTREIGVMRAIGASDGSVLRIVIVEGIIIGLLSWAMGALLAFPVGALLAQTVGVVLFQSALPYVFSASGLATWLAIVVVLATLASFLPAWKASRLTVREVLAYQ
jgi:putative ABC transport system permease protein